MAEGRHSFVAFYPSDWLGGTARMTRIQRSVYFDICCYNWDKAGECPPSDLALMLGDLDGWEKIVDLLVAAGKLYRTPDGSVGNPRAIQEAKIAQEKYARACRRIDGRINIASEIWKEIRRRIFARDDYTCRYCGKRGGALECDHVIPVVAGGDSDDSNLVTACRPCNRSKGAKLNWSHAS